MTPPDSSTHAVPVRGARRQAVRSQARPAATGLVAERLRVRKRRVAVIRRRVAAIAAATFLATSGGIFVQLATGNDPALASAAAKTAAVTSAANTTAPTSAASTSSSGSGNATAVTTSQS
jgi:hypothetical protein